jgi:hypothetical protein
MLGVARVMVRASREPSPRQRRWALLRALAADSARARNRDDHRRF